MPLVYWCLVVGLGVFSTLTLKFSYLSFSMIICLCHCLQNLPVLSEEEEIRVKQVIDQLKEQASKRRLMMYQYFKDYDRVSIYGMPSSKQSSLSET